MRWLPRILLSLAVVVALALAASARAEYPDKPVHLILPFPGGEGEVVGRALAQALTKSLGQAVVVENKPGAAGNIAADFVAHASPDGYTLLMGFSTIFEINPQLYKSIRFDAEKGFTQVALIAETQFVLIVNPAVPAKSIRELVDYAKANPGKLTFASAGIGSPLHLAGELFMAKAGVRLLHVPYKGGGEAAVAVLGGFADVLFGSVSASIGNIQAGKVRALGVTGAKRLKIFPDVPTIAEGGVAGYDVTAWHCVSAPAGTPKPIVQRLNAELVKAIATPEVRETLERVGLVPAAASGDEVTRRIRDETETWRRVIKEAEIRPE